MNIAICDDDKSYIESMENYFEKLESRCLSYDVYQSGEEIVAAYEKNNATYDAIFLDMEMCKLDGIETANNIRQYDRHVIIIFVTSHTKYMQKSFECEPFRFLVKPITFTDVEKVFREINIKLENNKETFVFNENRNTIRLFCENILYFEALNHWTFIYTATEEYKICKSMSELCKTINQDIFCKTHKSFIVNTNEIKAIRDDKILLYHSERSIPLSRTYKKNVVSMIMKSKERKYLV